MARFLITNDRGEVRSVVLGDGETTIGRAPESTIVLEGDGVSRRHVLVRRTAAGFVAEDLGSKNGTIVNGETVAQPRLLVAGDVIALPGWTLRLDQDETVTILNRPAPGQSLPARQPRLVELRAETREVLVQGRLVQLAPKEYLALALLYERAGKVVTKGELADRVWPEYSGDVSDYNIHQVISRLRRELEPDPAHPRVLITRPGFGYLLSI